MLIPSHKFISASVVALALSLSGAAFAQDAGFYVSGSVGKSRVDINTSDFAAAGFTGTSKDETDTAWKLNFGYQFNRNWGIEFGYVDFGDFSVDTNFNDPVLGTVPASATQELDAWTLAAVGTVPLGDSHFSLYGKLGFARSKSDVSGRAAATAFGDTDRETDIFGAIGVRYDFNRNFGILLELDHYNFEDKVNTLTAGVRFQF